MSGLPLQLPPKDHHACCPTYLHFALVTIFPLTQESEAFPLLFLFRSHPHRFHPASAPLQWLADTASAGAPERGKFLL